MIALEFKYVPFLKLSMFHSYHTSQLSKNFSLKATSPTILLFKELDFIWRPNTEGFHLLFDLKQIELLLRILEEKNHLKFSFYLHTADKYFSNYTAMPIDMKNKILYVNNLDTHNKLGEQNCLHANSFMNEQQVYALKTHIITYTPTKKNITITLKNVLQENIWEQKVNSTDPINISNIPDGLYAIYENNALQETFVFINQYNTSNPPITFIDIIINDQQKAEILKLAPLETIPFYEYMLAFDSRKSYWKYYIIAKQQLQVDHLKINTHETSIHFKGPETEKLLNGEYASVFLSESVLPIAETPTYNFELEMEVGMQGKNHYVNRKLPIPDVNYIFPLKGDQSKTVSNIIVYL